MNLQDYAMKILDTTKEDWTIFSCAGFGSGPSYLQSLSVWTNGKNEFENIEISSHPMRASLKKDLSIWIAWGYPSNPDFQESWANKFPDPKASSGIVDFFYNDVLVFRDLYVSVDGYRCQLPLPDRDFDHKTHEVLRHTVPKDKYKFFKMLDGFEKTPDFDDYFGQVKFEIVDDSWMV